MRPTAVVAWPDPGTVKGGGTKEYPLEVSSTPAALPYNLYNTTHGCKVVYYLDREELLKDTGSLQYGQDSKMVKRSHSQNSHSTYHACYAYP